MSHVLSCRHRAAFLVLLLTVAPLIYDPTQAECQTARLQGKTRRSLAWLPEKSARFAGLLKSGDVDICPSLAASSLPSVDGCSKSACTLAMEAHLHSNRSSLTRQELTCLVESDACAARYHQRLCAGANDVCIRRERCTDGWAVATRAKHVAALVAAQKNSSRPTRQRRAAAKQLKALFTVDSIDSLHCACVCNRVRVHGAAHRGPG